MLIVVIMSDDMIVRVQLPTMSGLKVVMYYADVCCSVVFGTLVGVFMFSVMWSELLIASAISCPLWSSVYECQRVECAFTSPVRNECGMFVAYCMQCCMSVSAIL